MAVLIAAVATLAGCSRELTTICAAEGDYLGASTAEAIRVPDDLTPPDQSEALRIPEVPGGPGDSSGCLDAPPLYSDVPGAISDVEPPSRRERRRAERAAEEAREAAEAEADGG
jgi:uncharacterized lipoprotein